jgi:hypothetical protein
MRGQWLHFAVTKNGQIVGLYREAAAKKGPPNLKCDPFLYRNDGTELVRFDGGRFIRFSS